ncbi:ferrous iron transporter FeoB [Schinkia azotoformans MEV2011]|uniref:Ferrous iron transport protein B n=1 Tax=Schinkia azotoformans MEV2011 TaxID=1348973 RepID=A0A072NKU9_SCHAZ|nr:ferrous iron transport protein B [Schinkia azotoformans]KEF38304.1 ferrous iron transporter FeoB [Schinkia azotoformans MEV2011]MEC1694048.1 ferrous iron transport protein B [Schinkia azotoformans]MEC1715760.1 ferrous iron transport protein B [Schinkia azotoformans]MEC1724947.1 ferrous iron transport protein B [Schinkia azotoformans]MEC1741399.1 ferrous iron transport protein B [Schinkia azotoformans]
MIEIALFGNPNTGKTSLFNSLTGSYEYVGNWSGVTVEKKVGLLRNKQGHLIDLPGIYSLNPLSKDERVVTDFLLHESFTEVLNIVDASQLERNLHLTVQLLEFGKPLIIGLNMMDVAKNRGIDINERLLGDLLGVRIVPIIARTGKGCDELSKLLVVTSTQRKEPLNLYYGSAIEKGIDKLSQLVVGKKKSIIEQLPPLRWLALQFYEGNKVVFDYLQKFISSEELEQLLLETEAKLIEKNEGKSLHQAIYNVRREFIDKIIAGVAKRNKADKLPLTERIDLIVTHKILGIPIFLFFMYLMFMLTFNWLGFPLSDALDAFFSGPLTEWLTAGLVSIGASDFIQSLILEGIVAGVGGVLVFVPQIFILFFFISFLEDSGYMARVALVMDRLMESVGLNGKSFIPMIIGFGCNVPGVMAARTIEQPKERLLTILLTPLMSCSARLPVYALFVGAFFAANQAFVVLALYVLGIVMALILAKIFSSTILKSETSVFVIELPPYRVPQFQTLARSTWDKGKGFVRKAGTFIFAGSVVIWLLSYAGPHGLAVEMDDSFLAMIGSVFAPLLAPIGFGTWQAGASLLTGFFAKEVVVSTMNIIYHVPDVDSLQGMLAGAYTPLSAFTFMAFVLLYVPCLATTATIQKETGSVKWTLFAIGYALVLAYVLCLIIYQVGRALGYA